METKNDNFYGDYDENEVFIFGSPQDKMRLLGHCFHDHEDFENSSNVVIIEGHDCNNGPSEIGEEPNNITNISASRGTTNSAGGLAFKTFSNSGQDSAPTGKHSKKRPLCPAIPDAQQYDEVLNAAKSLFTKRTRTLYHWLHPYAPKHEIKTAVSVSWDNLGSQEKDFYISQVLGRFGFHQKSLMVNPQLGGIRELASLSDRIDFNTSSNELQTAISSINDESSRLIYPMDQSKSHCSDKRKKRLGRPPGSKNKKIIRTNDLKSCTLNSHDFQDDPELSKELRQFAITLNMT